MSSEEPKGIIPLYEGEFLNEHGEIKVEQVEDEEKTSVKVIRDEEYTPSSIISEEEGYLSDQPLDIVPISTSSTSSTTSSISESEEIKVKTERSEDEPIFIKKEKESEKGRTADQPIEIFDDEEIIESKDFRNVHHKWDEKKIDMTRISEFLGIFMEKIVGNVTDNFMNQFGSLCHISKNNGVIYPKIAEKLLNILFSDDSRFNATENMLYRMMIFSLLQDFRYSDFKYISKLHAHIFMVNYNNIVTKKHEIWYVPFKALISSEEILESDNYIFIQFVSDYLLFVIQCINHLIINRKVNTHHVTERYVMECIFSVVKMMIFPNIGSQSTSCSMYDFIKSRDFEMEFLGRNVWLRQAWSLFLSVVYTESKLKIYPKKDGGEGKITYKDLLLSYQATTAYFDANIVSRRDKIEKMYKSKTILSKIVNEYENVIGVMNMVLYCFKIYMIFKQNQDYDVYHRITHAAWMWPRFRADIEQCEISENLKTTINALNWKSLYEDSKHLHSFRATRTFATPLPEKYWRAYDPQDVAASVRSDSILNQTCMKVADCFGLYESYNADLLIPQEKVNNMRELLYIKVSELRKLVASEKERYIKFSSNDDIPDFDSRRKIFELMENDNDDTVNNLKWIKINMDNPKSVFIKLDHDVVESQVSENIKLIKYDKINKMQIKRMIAIDQLKTDIKVAQSLLRYFEQLFDAYFVEARDFF